MIKLLEESFLSGCLPKEWLEPFRSCSFEDGFLRSKTGAVLHIPLPGETYEKTLIEVEIEPLAGAKLTCSDGVSTFVIDIKRGTHLINHSGPGLLAETRTEAITTAIVKVSFLFDRGALRAFADGVELISSRDPNPFVSSSMFDLGFWDDCRIRKITAYGDGPTPATLVSSVASFELEMNVDFFDDLRYAAWTEEMFDDLFAKYKNWGVTRCHWIHYGNQSEGWWAGAPMGVAQNAAKTVENVGEIFPAAVRAAHRHGIEIFALIKPFDVGISPHHQAGIVPSNAAGLPRIGGPVHWIANFPRLHREWIIARKPDCAGSVKGESFTRIDIVKDNDAIAGFTVDDINIFVSDDNATYRLYEGPLSRKEVVESHAIWEHTSSGGRATKATRMVRIMRLSELEIRHQFVVLQVDSSNGTFQNSLINLLHVFGKNGEERLLTYGLSARGGAIELTDNVSAVSPDIDFQKYGVNFDLGSGTPSSIFPGYDPISACFTLDEGEGIIAFAAGKDDGALAALSPSIPEVRAWWLSWIRDCLDAGADGIELRERNHHAHLTWGEFGFEPPVRDAYLKQYKVDLWATDDFDKIAWAKLRGEAYTEFYREARALTNSYGKPLGLHVSLTNNLGPKGSSSMNIHWNWKGWLNEGLADSITLKDVLPGSRFAREVMTHALANNVRVIYSPYANNLWSRPGGDEICRRWIMLAREFGYSGFQFYENAAIVRGTKEGFLDITQPTLPKILQKEFRQTPPLFGT